MVISSKIATFCCLEGQRDSVWWNTCPSNFSLYWMFKLLMFGQFALNKAQLESWDTSLWPIIVVYFLYQTLCCRVNWLMDLIVKLTDCLQCVFSSLSYCTLRSVMTDFNPAYDLWLWVWFHFKWLLVNTCYDNGTMEVSSLDLIKQYGWTFASFTFVYIISIA